MSKIKVANKKGALDRIKVSGKEEQFITLKDHEPNFENNAPTRLIDLAKSELAKSEIGRTSNTTVVINWFEKIENRNKKKHWLRVSVGKVLGN